MFIVCSLSDRYLYKLVDINKIKGDRMDIFKNKEILDMDYIPESELLVHREKELSEVKPLFDSIEKGHSNLVCYGFAGTGKTAILKFLMREHRLKPNERIIYINHSTNPTELQAVSEVLNQLGIKARGRFLNVFYRTLGEVIKNYDLKMLVILDEVDRLIERAGDSFIYNLLEMGNITLIMVTNNVMCLDKIEPRTKSRLGLNRLLFPTYDANKMGDILNRRAEKAFKEGVLEYSVVPRIAAMTAQEHGDARKALALLKNCGEIAERMNVPIIDTKLIELADDISQYGEVESIVKSYSNQVKIALKSVLNVIERNSVIDASLSEIYGEYVRITTDMGVKTVSERRVSDFIWDLDNAGITHTKFSTRKSGKEMVVRLGIPLKVIRKIMEKELY